MESQTSLTHAMPRLKDSSVLRGGRRPVSRLTQLYEYRYECYLGKNPGRFPRSSSSLKKKRTRDRAPSGMGKCLYLSRTSAGSGTSTCRRSPQRFGGALCSWWGHVSTRRPRYRYSQTYSHHFSGRAPKMLGLQRIQNASSTTVA
jgi:hypothetical protein